MSHAVRLEELPLPYQEQARRQLAPRDAAHGGERGLGPAGATPGGSRVRMPPRGPAGSGRRGRGPNKTEAAYRVQVLDRRGDVAAIHYEGLTLRMANGHRYTPDWMVVTAGGRIECHEVKGGHALHSQQRARLAFDQARVEFPWLAWTWATRTKDGWKVGG